MATGTASYVNANIVVVYGGTYTGGGTAGYSGGTTATIATKTRKPEVDRPRLSTTDGSYKTAVGGTPSCRVSFDGYFKGSSPPAGMANEFVKVACTQGFVFNGVVLVEKFGCIGDVDGALMYEFAGETDDTFTLA